ncbi:MAG: hydrogenase maturation nickel metallochaperone HypA, partial [Oscillospiraceae bacterium]|nr:hydrogenase maturation nickel metallochaperone HypA [Oscillospiraceae bacterium]
MHELGICDALLKMVRGIAKDEELEEISRITVEVGSLSGVVPAYMSD